MITAVTLTNFRSHSSTKVPLERFTLLVGPNSVGKTQVLNAVHLVGQAFGKKTAELLQGEKSPQWLIRSKANNAVIRLDGVVSPLGNQVPWWAELHFENDPSRTTLSWELHGIQGKEGGKGSPGSEEARAAPFEVGVARSAVVLRLNARALTTPSTSEDVEPRIEFDGKGFATALKELKATRLEEFLKFEDAAKKVLPDLRAIGFERVRQEEIVHTPMTLESVRVSVPRNEVSIADGVLLQFNGTELLPAHCASEGTMLTLGLLAFLHLPKCPRVLLLDDIDRGLHPRAQVELAERIRSILDARPDTQVIATSHSPYLVDCFRPEEVVVLSRDGGHGAARRLEDHPDKKLLRSFKTGEFLSASGEDWFGL